MAAQVDNKKCDGCENCVSECPVSAIRMQAGLAVVNDADGTGCGACASTCPKEAISVE